MNKLKAIFVTFLMFMILFSIGCFEEEKRSESKKNDEVTLSDLMITIDDLPNNYTQYFSGKKYLSEFSNRSSESLVKWFTDGIVPDLKTNDLITCELNKFNTSEDAIDRYERTIQYFINERNFSVISDSINRIGDESKDLEKEGFTDLLTYRLSNFIVVMSSKNYTFTYELAKIVEQKINDSFI